MTESIVLDGKVRPVQRSGDQPHNQWPQDFSWPAARSNTWTETLDEFRARVQAELDADRVRLAPRPCTNTE